jgi:ferric-dicitrate binding protein FerR (iron transport regulator)
VRRGVNDVTPGGEHATAALRGVALVMLAVGSLTDASARNAWSSGGLVPLIYHGRPLPEVIEDVQRYTQRRIMIRADMRTFQYSGIVKPEDVDAWIQDLPAIYPVEVIDCRTYGRRGEMSACADPELIVIRSRLELHRNELRSALR